MENILIINGEKFTYNSLLDIMNILLGSDYYSLSIDKRKQRLFEQATLNTLNQNLIVTQSNNLESIDNAIIIDNEFTYLYSLIINNIITILEKTESNILSNFINKEKIKDNYINLYPFAKQALLKELKK